MVRGEGGNGERKKDPNIRNSTPGKGECVSKRGSQERLGDGDFHTAAWL